MRLLPSKATAKALGKALLMRILLVLSIAFTLFVFSLPTAPQEVKDVVGTICVWAISICGAIWLAIVTYVLIQGSKKGRKDNTDPPQGTLL